VVIKTNLAPSYIARMCHGFETVIVISRVCLAKRGEEKRIHFFFDIAGIGLGFMPMFIYRQSLAHSMSLLCQTLTDGHL
jgi:hypothetical protein